MGVRFEAPVWLLLLVPALALTLVPALAARRRIGAARRRAALAVRVVVVASLVFALAGFQLVLPVDRLATVFVVDLSDSVGANGRAECVGTFRGIRKLDGPTSRGTRRAGLLQGKLQGSG